MLQISKRILTTWQPCKKKKKWSNWRRKTTWIGRKWSKPFNSYENSMSCNVQRGKKPAKRPKEPDKRLKEPEEQLVRKRLSCILECFVHGPSSGCLLSTFWWWCYWLQDSQRSFAEDIYDSSEDGYKRKFRSAKPEARESSEQ